MIAPAAPALAKAELIANQLTPGHPLNGFRHVMFNYCANPPQGVPPGQDPATWAEIQRNNPDPTRCVPVLATSFADLEGRIETQKQTADANMAAVGQIKSKVASLDDKAAGLTLRLHAAQHRQVELAAGLLRHVNRLTALGAGTGQGTGVSSAFVRAVAQLKDRITGDGRLFDTVVQLDARADDVAAPQTEPDLPADARAPVMRCLEQMQDTVRRLQDVVREDAAAVSTMLGRG